MLIAGLHRLEAAKVLGWEEVECTVSSLGRADFSTSDNALRFARVILEKYKGQRGGRKLPYRFRG